MITMDDKYRLEDFGLVALLGHENPLTPTFENNSMHVAGRPGMWNFGTEVKEKLGTIPIAIIEYDEQEKQRKLNDFVAFLYDDFGKPRPIKVVYDYEPDKYITLWCGQLSVERLVNAAKFELPVVAYDPYKKLNIENHEINWDSMTATYDDSWSIDTVFVDDQLIPGNQTVETYVNGLALRPDILINGSGNNVAFSVNGKSFTLKNFTNANFLIRGSDYTCFKNGVENLTEMTGDHLTLLPGENAVKITGTNMNLNLSIRVRDQYN